MCDTYVFMIKAANCCLFVLRFFSNRQWLLGLVSEQHELWQFWDRNITEMKWQMTDVIWPSFSSHFILKIKSFLSYSTKKKCVYCLLYNSFCNQYQRCSTPAKWRVPAILKMAAFKYICIYTRTHAQNKPGFYLASLPIMLKRQTNTSMDNGWTKGST